MESAAGTFVPAKRHPRHLNAETSRLRLCGMKPEHLKQFIDGWWQWTETLTPEEHAKGFKVDIPQWEDDYFDRYIRDEYHLRRIIRYIERSRQMTKEIDAAGMLL